MWIIWPKCPHARSVPSRPVTAAVAGWPPVAEEEESPALSPSLWECCPGWGGGGKGPDALPGAVDCSDPRNPPGADRAPLSGYSRRVYLCAHPSP